MRLSKFLTLLFCVYCGVNRKVFANSDLIEICNKNGAGSWGIESDPTCSTYVYCYNIGNEFNLVVMTCRGNNYFDPQNRLCVSDKSVCNNNNVQTTITNQETSTPVPNKNICEVDGSQTNVNDNTCRTYIYCFKAANGVLTEVLLSCNNGFYFDNLSRLCTSRKPEECTDSVIEMSTTQDLETTTNTPIPISCAELGVGAHANKNDSTCKTFLYCFKNQNVWMNIIQSCAEKQYFDSQTQTCSPRKPNGCLSDENGVSNNDYNNIKGFLGEAFNKLNIVFFLNQSN
ncbi:uncharacterized protein LOC119673031 [Teleopsis dalmanni]|uniref:uncharacterized protein LOC119673031 n=1 Tax=Teleopsis dalmanni TaxID=139649 RepID=UPI0018CEA3E8|nr:uncharacterized protein LOC119673031 [Teleopsis dalmanni]